MDGKWKKCPGSTTLRYRVQGLTQLDYKPIYVDVVNV
jgi:hypothetical protein